MASPRPGLVLLGGLMLFAVYNSGGDGDTTLEERGGGPGSDPRLDARSRRRAVVHLAHER
jgi:hypothetical protein